MKNPIKQDDGTTTRRRSVVSRGGHRAREEDYFETIIDRARQRPTMRSYNEQGGFRIARTKK